MLLSFMCTRPAGWEAEDVGSLLAVLAAAGVVVALSWLLGRRWARPGLVRALWVAATSVLLAPLAVAGAVVVWLAPC